jgi:hypothetical protein
MPALAALACKYLPLFKKNGKRGSMTNTSSNEESIVASNLPWPASSEWIIANFHKFIPESSHALLSRRRSKHWLLAFHRQCNKFGEQKRVQGVCWMYGWNWKERIEGTIGRKFFAIMVIQVQHKHNGWYLCTASLVQSMFSEFKTGQIIARFLRGEMYEMTLE